MRSSRGALVPEYLVKVIAALLLMVTLFLVIQTVYLRATHKTIETTCEASVAARAQSMTDIPGAGRIAPAPLLCRTQYGDAVPKTSSIFSLGSKEYDVENNFAMAQKNLAEYSKSCWKMFGRGTIPFAKERVTLDSDTQCFSCYDVAYPSRLPPMSGRVFKDDYMVSHNAEREIKRGGEIVPAVSYYDYITRGGGCGYIVIPEQFVPGQRYSIVFVGQELPVFLGQYAVNGLGYAAEFARDNPRTATGIGLTTAFFGRFIAGKVLAVAVSPPALFWGLVVGSVGFIGKELYDYATYDEFNTFDSQLNKIISAKGNEDIMASKIAGLISNTAKQIPNEGQCSGIWILPTHTVPQQCFKDPAPIPQ